MIFYFIKNKSDHLESLKIKVIELILERIRNQFSTLK